MSIVEHGNAARNALAQIVPPNYLSKRQWPTLVCKDGFTVSVQASASHFSTPKVDNAADYTHYELGYPNWDSDALEPFGDFEHGIYAQVPADIVAQLLAEHGGVDLDKTVQYALRMWNLSHLAPVASATA